MARSGDSLFKIIFDQSVEPKIVLFANHPDYTIAAANQAYATATFSSAQELENKSLWELFRSDAASNNSTADFRKGLNKVAVSGMALRLPLYPFDILSTDRKTVLHKWWEVEITPLKDERGETTLLVCTTYDITALVDLTDALQAAKELEAGVSRTTKKLEEDHQALNRMVMGNHAGMLTLTGPDLVVTVINKAALAIFGSSEQQIAGQPLLSAIPILAEQPLLTFIDHVYHSGKPMAVPDVPITLLSNDNSFQHMFLDTGIVPLPSNDGKIKALLLTLSDVTLSTELRQQLQQQQKQTEALNEEVTVINEELTAANEELIVSNEELTQAQDELQQLYEKLEESEAVFRGIFDWAPLGIFHLTGTDLLITEVNGKGLELMGHCPEDVTNRSAREVWSTGSSAKLLVQAEQTFVSGHSIRINEMEMPLRHHQQLSSGYLNVVFQPVKDSSGKVLSLLLMMEDITERVVVRQKIDQAQEEFNQAVSTANLGIWSIDVKEQKLQTSPTFITLFGLRQDDTSIAEAMQAVDPEYRVMVEKAIINGLSKNESCDIEYRITNLRTKEKLWVRATGKMFFDAFGKPDRFAGILADITERKEDDSRKNDFIAMVSHELKNPLTSAKGFLQLIQLQLPDTLPEEKMMIAKSLKQLTRMGRLIEGYLGTARLQSGKLNLLSADFDLNELVEEAVIDSEIVYPHNPIIFLRLDNATIYADKEKIMQVVQNFISNAVKYSPARSKVIISGAVKEHELIINVKDQGPGIAREDQERIFQRFQRLNSNNAAQVAGFGIGLYLSKEIIHRHGGQIGVDSDGLNGSTFYFTIPRT